MLDTVLLDLLIRQAGILSRTQALERGLTTDQVRHRLRRGWWVAVADGVYRVTAYPETHESRLWAAWVASNGDGAISHEAAAALHGLATFGSASVVITVPHANNRLEGLAVVHQSRRLYPEHVTSLDGLGATTVPRTLIDLAAHHRFGRVEIALDHALSTHLMSLDDMLTTFDDLACRGRRGTRMIRELLAPRAPGYVPPGSVLESLFLQLLRRHGLPRPVLQFPHPSPAMDGRRVDAAYVAERILIELDGRGSHDRSPRDHERDRERDVEARRVGWDPYRFTYRNVTQQEDWVARVLHDVLRVARRFRSA